MEEKKTNQDMEELKDEELEAASGGFMFLLLDPQRVHCRGCGKDILVSDPSTFTCPNCGYKC